MDKVAASMVTQVYILVFNQIRHKMAGAIDDGDVSLNKLKQSLLNEFERIKNKLDHILGLSLSI